MKVWIAMVDKPHLVFMYGPTLRMLHDGFEAAKRVNLLQSYSFIFTKSLHRNLSISGVGDGPWDACDDERTRLTAGDLLIYVGVPTWGPRVAPWDALRSIGVRSVHYNLEPYESDDFCGRRGLLVGADELWEYSHRNIWSCNNYYRNRIHLQDRPNATAPVLRFVPPTPIAGPRLPRQPSSHEASLMLWGAVFSYRKACWQKLSQESPRLKPRTTTVYTVWNLSTLAAALDRRDAGIFLDIYKECNYSGLLKSPGQTRAPPATGAFLRLGVIGAARGLLISTRCYWRDEQEYDGLIDVRESSSARCCLRDPMVSCVAWPVAWPVA